ncbi:MAG: class I SAM-dependent methyltransferase [Thermoplasmata archaeon]
MAFFDAVYQRGVPPWDIGHPQREFVHLEETGEVEGRVLDVGCGTGENALYFERRGHPTWGVDFSPTAIARARAKAAERGLAVTFQVASALELSALHETFDTVTDCGLFHTFSDEERIRYSASVASVLRPGGRCYILCFSEHEPPWGGPRRVTQAEIRATFRAGWRVRWIHDGHFEARDNEFTGRAWLAALSRLRTT